MSVQRPDALSSNLLDSCYDGVMKHLVIAVSPDSSLELIGACADIILLDQGQIPAVTKSYETLYIRSHFSKPETMPQVFRSEIELIIKQAIENNPNIRFIDEMNTVDEIVAYEDKWLQYQRFSNFMPDTELLNANMDASTFKRPVYKNRLSSRGTGVTWDSNKITGSKDDWIVQESLDIDIELRMYVIGGEVHPVGLVCKSMSEGVRVSAVESRNLLDDEVELGYEVGKQASRLDFLGLDIARTTNGKLQLIEANRSPGFVALTNMTGINLAHLLYDQDR